MLAPASIVASRVVRWGLGWGFMRGVWEHSLGWGQGGCRASAGFAEVKCTTEARRTRRGWAGGGLVVVGVWGWVVPAALGCGGWLFVGGGWDCCCGVGGRVEPGHTAAAGAAGGGVGWGGVFVWCLGWGHPYATLSRQRTAIAYNQIRPGPNKTRLARA